MIDPDALKVECDNPEMECRSGFFEGSEVTNRCGVCQHEYEVLQELFTAKTIHLGLVDLKREMEFDSHEEAEGARKLVERFAFEMGVHGRQILEDEVNRDD